MIMLQIHEDGTDHRSDSTPGGTSAFFIDGMWIVVPTVGLEVKERFTESWENTEAEARGTLHSSRTLQRHSGEAVWILNALRSESSNLVECVQTASCDDISYLPALRISS